MVEGLCDICGGAAALQSCKLCGKRICSSCMTERGVCKVCLSGMKY